MADKWEGNERRRSGVKDRRVSVDRRSGGRVVTNTGSRRTGKDDRRKSTPADHEMVNSPERQEESD